MRKWEVFVSFLTSFWHPLSSLNPGIQHFFCRHKENSISCLGSIHHTQLIHQETGTALHVLPAHLRDKPDKAHMQLNLLYAQSLKGNSKHPGALCWSVTKSKKKNGKKKLVCFVESSGGYRSDPTSKASVKPLVTSSEMSRVMSCSPVYTLSALYKTPKLYSNCAQHFMMLPRRARVSMNSLIPMQREGT